MEHAKLAKKSWNFVISHGILPILPPNCAKFVCILPALRIKNPCRKSVFSDVFSKIP